MDKRIRNMLILCCFSPLFTQCVQTQDVTNLDLRIRSLDNRLVKLDKTIATQLGGDGQESPIGKLQLKQAEMADQLDRLNMEMLQIKGQLDESSHHARKIMEGSDELKSTLSMKVDELAEQITLLADQLNQTREAINETRQTNAEMALKLRAAEEKAAAAEQAALQAAEQRQIMEKAAADEKAKAAAATANGRREIAPEQSKLRPQEKKAAAEPEESETGPGKEIYEQGLALFREGKFNEAYRTFTAYIAQNPTGKMAPNARFWLGDCYYNQQEYELAILEYQKVIADHPNHAKAPAALLKQGLAFEKLNDLSTAKIVYKKLLVDYAKSEQVETAKKRINSMK